MNYLAQKIKRRRDKLVFLYEKYKELENMELKENEIMVDQPKIY
jgi:hypothetical protein